MGKRGFPLFEHDQEALQGFLGTLDLYLHARGVVPHVARKPKLSGRVVNERSKPDTLQAPFKADQKALHTLISLRARLCLKEGPHLPGFGFVRNRTLGI